MGTKTCTHNLCSEQNLKIHLKIIIFTIVKIAVLRRRAIVKCLNHIVRKGNFSIPPGETFSKYVLILIGTRWLVLSFLLNTASMDEQRGF